MTCYHPIQGYWAKTVNPSGKRGIVFNRKDGFTDKPIKVPCGQCIGCRLEYSRQWAIRCMHEAQMHEENSFITLTYDEDNCPHNRSLDVTHFQKFMKRLRKAIAPEKVRFFHCGEYGEEYARPHYHACLFGYDFPDKVLWKVVRGNRIYVSDLLADLWGQGFATIGDVNFKSAAYVARYATKKITGDARRDHYLVVDQHGEIHERKAEYATMSRRPGIGQPWLDKYESDVYPRGYVVVNGRRVRPPKYYDDKFELASVEAARSMKGLRVRKAKMFSHDQTPDRLTVRHKVQALRLEQLKRTLK